MQGSGEMREVEHECNAVASLLEKPAIMVLGMHRSGTSCLVGSLQQRGLHLGDVQEWNPHNRKGNRESLRIMHLNNAVLEHSGGAWDRPPQQALTWTREHVVERDAIIAILRDGAGGPWGFKDPRTALTLPFWQEGLPDARLVGAFRHPARVARSLHARSRLSYEQAFELWRIYNGVLLREHARAPFPLVCFDLAEAAYLDALNRMAGELGLSTAGPGEPAFFERSLRHEDDGDELPVVPEDVTAIHQRLLRASTWERA